MCSSDDPKQNVAFLPESAGRLVKLSEINGRGSQAQASARIVWLHRLVRDVADEIPIIGPSAMEGVISMSRYLHVDYKQASERTRVDRRVPRVNGISQDGQGEPTGNGKPILTNYVAHGYLNRRTGLISPESGCLHTMKVIHEVALFGVINGALNS